MIFSAAPPARRDAKREGALSCVYCSRKQFLYFIICLDLSSSFWGLDIDFLDGTLCISEVRRILLRGYRVLLNTEPGLVLSVPRPEPRRVTQPPGTRLGAEPCITLSLALRPALVLTANGKNLPERGIAEL